jgi:hypothetical protein
MTKPTRRAIVLRVSFYVAFLGFVLAVWQFQTYLAQGVVEAPVSSLNPLQKSQLDAFLAMNSLVTTLTTGLLGALGFLLLNGRKVSRQSITAKWLAFGSALSAALSLFFGYVVYLALLDMLGNEAFDLSMPPIYWARQAHFYTFLLSVVLFGDFAFHAFFTVGRYEDNRHPAHR